MTRDFNLHNVEAVSVGPHRYPVLSAAGPASVWINLPAGAPVPEGAKLGAIRGVAMVNVAGLTLHRRQGT